MSIAAFAALTVAASGGDIVPAPPAVMGSVAGETVILAQIQIQRNTIIRIPPARNLPSLKFKEKEAPKCIKWSQMAAAMVSSPTTIDLIIRGGTRYRVKLQKTCQAIDFYSGFYVRSTKDGQVCEDRDMIHSRSGGECGISKFKTLVPDK
jgi:hypothetical protein